MRAYVLASAALILSASSANAAVLTIAGSNARSCYLAAEARSPSMAALADCETALSVQPLSDDDRVATYTNRGILRMVGGDRSGALADYNAASALDPRHPEPYLNKSVLIFDEGDNRVAAQFAERALELGTHKPGVAYFVLALTKEDAGDVKAAYHDLLRASQLEPRWSLPRQELARYQVRPR